MDWYRKRLTKDEPERLIKTEETNNKMLKRMFLVRHRYG